MRTLSLAATMSAALLTGCALPQMGSGVEATEERVVDAFSGVSNQISLEVTVTQGEPSVVVTCDDNLLDFIVTDVKNGVLRIRTDLGVSIAPSRFCVVDLTTNDLESLSVSGSGGILAEGDWSRLSSADASGSGSIDVTGVALAGRFESTVSGSGNVRVEGSAGSADLRVTGSGSFEGLGLQVGDADVEVTGSGSASIHASGVVDARVTGSGDIVIAGEPTRIDRTVTGSGSIQVR